MSDELLTFREAELKRLALCDRTDSDWKLQRVLSAPSSEPKFRLVPVVDEFRRTSATVTKVFPAFAFAVTSAGRSLFIPSGRSCGFGGLCEGDAIVCDVEPPGPGQKLPMAVNIQKAGSQ